METTGSPPSARSGGRWRLPMTEVDTPVPLRASTIGDRGSVRTSRAELRLSFNRDLLDGRPAGSVSGSSSPFDDNQDDDGGMSNPGIFCVVYRASPKSLSGKKVYRASPKSLNERKEARGGDTRGSLVGHSDREQLPSNCV